MSEKSERSLTDLQHAVWVLVEEQRVTNRLLRVLCDASGVGPEQAAIPDPPGAGD